MTTKAQREALRWLLSNPGGSLFDYYESRRQGESWGLQRVAIRGAAGRMFFALLERGLVEGHRHLPIVTAEGEEAADV